MDNINYKNFKSTTGSYCTLYLNEFRNIILGVKLISLCMIALKIFWQQANINFVVWM